MNAETFFKWLMIQDKTGELKPLILNQAQKIIYSELTNRTLILKARQLGVSTLIQAEIFRRLLTHSTSALTLAHDDTTTQMLRDMSDRFYKYFPKIEGVQKIQRTIANARVTKYDDSDAITSRHVIGTAGNEEIGRGGTYNIIHGSEVAFWKDPEKIISGATQGGNPIVILESTANGATGWFYERCMDALSGRGGWNLIFIPWHMNPEYQIDGSKEKWKEQKLAELGSKFAQEYPENVLEAFLVSNRGYFSDIDLSNTFIAPRNTPRIPGHIYSAGLDFGQSNDFTFMPVFDRTDRRQVDYLHINKTSWNLQRQEIKKMYEKWGLNSIKAETNSIGDVNIEELENDGVHIERFATTNKSKNEIMQRFHEALENGLKLIDWEVQKAELMNMTSKQTATGLWTISAEYGHDDTVIGNALGYTAHIGKREIKYY